MGRVIFDIETVELTSIRSIPQSGILLKWAENEEEEERIKRVSLLPSYRRDRCIGLLNPDTDKGQSISRLRAICSCL